MKTLIISVSAATILFIIGACFTLNSPIKQGVVYALGVTEIIAIVSAYKIIKNKI